MEKVEITAKVEHETEKAFLCNDGTASFWLPKSQIKWSMHANGDYADFEIPRWLAEEKGIV